MHYDPTDVGSSTVQLIIVISKEGIQSVLPPIRWRNESQGWLLSGFMIYSFHIWLVFQCYSVFQGNMQGYQKLQGGKGGVQTSNTLFSLNFASTKFPDFEKIANFNSCEI